MSKFRAPPTLRYLTTHSFCLHLFRAQIRWRRLSDVARGLKEILNDMHVPKHIWMDLHEAIGEILREVQRWGEKHAEMFDGYEMPKSKERAHRSEHLRTFYYCLQWIPDRYEINDVATAREIVLRECQRWPQMHFQFACVYAMQEDLEDGFKFDKYRVATFRKRLLDHPVYDFWLSLLPGGENNWDNMFNMDNRTPNQRLMLCFRFAITHGYAELTQFLWHRISPQHREYMGLLQWRAICFRSRSRETMRFLCSQLCAVNPIAVARLTWTTFYDALYKSINNEENDVVVDKKNLKKLEFLLEHCCPILRERLLSMENYRAVTDAFRYNQGEMFAFMLERLTDEQLPVARERVDRIHDRNRSSNGNRLQSFISRRQMTVD